MNRKTINKGLIIAAWMNFSVLIFSRGFTNVAINEADPVVMSNFGLLMIVIWGMAYWAASTVTSNIQWIAGVFALEKLIYGVIWINWHLNNSLEGLYATDAFAGAFYAIYGLNDLGFMVFFAWVFFSRTGKEAA